MRNLEKLFLKRKIDYNKLIEYGFKKESSMYSFNKCILDNQFEVQIHISENEKVSKVFDCFDNSEYVLVDVENAIRNVCWKYKRRI